jgi:hypothetical protein
MMLPAYTSAWLVAWLEKVGVAELATISIAGKNMLIASFQATFRAGADLIDGKDRGWLERTAGAILLTHEAPAPVGTAQVCGTVNVAVNGTTRLMALADHAFTARALCHLVLANDLIAAAFALTGTVVAKPACTAGRGIV